MVDRNKISGFVDKANSLSKNYRMNWFTAFGILLKNHTHIVEINPEEFDDAVDFIHQNDMKENSVIVKDLNNMIFFNDEEAATIMKLAYGHSVININDL